jgi:hypothetical protein
MDGGQRMNSLAQGIKGHGAPHLVLKMPRACHICFYSSRRFPRSGTFEGVEGKQKGQKEQKRQKRLFVFFALFALFASSSTTLLSQLQNRSAHTLGPGIFTGGKFFSCAVSFFDLAVISA